MTTSEKKESVNYYFPGYFQKQPFSGVLNIWESCRENIFGRVFSLLKLKRIYYLGCFPEKFLEFFRITILQKTSSF